MASIPVHYNSPGAQTTRAAADAAGAAGGALLGVHTATSIAIAAKLGGLIGTAILPGIGTVLGVWFGVKLARKIVCH